MQIIFSFPLGSLVPLWSLWKWSSAHVYARGRKPCCKLHYCLSRLSIKARLPFSICNVFFVSKGNLFYFYLLLVRTILKLEAWLAFLNSLGGNLFTRDAKVVNLYCYSEVWKVQLVYLVIGRASIPCDDLQAPAPPPPPPPPTLPHAKGAVGITIQWHIKCHMLELTFTSTVSSQTSLGIGMHSPAARPPPPPPPSHLHL